LETIEALAMALNNFEGGVVLVSHDERLISLVVDEIWQVKKGDMLVRTASAGVRARVQRLVRGVQGEATEGVRRRVAADEQEEEGKGGEGGAGEGGEESGRDT
jgi:ATPase subunit of ABC transporter with duplicated ATPase domains